MNFELNDVASSSSSSSSSSSPPSSSPPSPSRSDREGDARSGEADENLAYELRSALHLAVGRICRAEEEDAAADGGGDDDDDDDDRPAAAFAMSDEAIVALTDLTYHYATSCLASDLVAFSSHARRRTVRIDDVLLVARKDGGGILSELRRVVSENPDVYGGGTGAEIGGGGKSRVDDGAGRPRKGAVASAAVVDRARRSSKISNRSKSLKGKTTREKQCALSLSSSSSSSSSSSDGDGGGVAGRSFKMRRRKLELEREGLRNAAHRRDDGAAGKKGDAKDSDDFVANDDVSDGGDGDSDSDSDSDSEVEFEFETTNDERAPFGDSSRKWSNDSRRGTTRKSGGLDTTTIGHPEDDDAMVIDLSGD